MNETRNDNRVDNPVVKVQRDLTEIQNLATELAQQAAHKANDPLMPGGHAMVALAPVANIEAWEHRYETAERLGRDTTWVSDEDDTWEPPLQTLRFWTDRWRRDFGADWDHIPTIGTEARFIRWALDEGAFTVDHPDWPHLARDIRRARVRLENTLYAGNRAKRTHVVCDRLSCETPSRLIKVYSAEVDGSGDHYKCPSCKYRYDDRGFLDAQARHLRNDGARRFVLGADARGMLTALGRSERTFRQWLAADKITWYCDVSTHQVWVWWPDVWTTHLATPQRKRAA